MARPRWHIVQVSTRDVLGGAEKVALDLFQAYRERGHASNLIVGYRRRTDPDILEMPHELTRRSWSRFWWRWHRRLQPHYDRSAWARRWCRWTHNLAEPKGKADRRRGFEDFHFPGARHLLEIFPSPPDLLHLHNLHGGYFDLRALPHLCRRLPVFITLHDAWLLSGHCAHSLDCDRWKTGCGICPYPELYPAVLRDETATNWQRKRDILADSSLYVSTPCHWMRERLSESILAPAILESRVIPYGVDLSVFHRGDRERARAALGLPQDSAVLLMVGAGLRRSPWKDFAMLREALDRLGGRVLRRAVCCVALGDEGPTEQIGRIELRFEPFRSDAAEVARFYQAADVYVHAARADTFPNAILEALCCGAPVVGTNVGGIPEQVRALILPGTGRSGMCGPGRATGILTPAGDVEALTEAIARLVEDEPLRRGLAENAAEDAARRFPREAEVEAYLDWYGEILERSGKAHRSIRASAPVRESDTKPTATPAGA